MSKTDDGGPAFPRPGYVMSQDCEPEQWKAGYEGMSLRDWFAGQVLAGICSSVQGLAAAGSGKEVAAIAYDFADCMLAERAKETK